MRPGRSLDTIAPSASLSDGGSMAARTARKKSTAPAGSGPMSPDIRPNGPIAMEQVFNGFGCSGGNISPALGWSGAPEGTKSFALLVHDPDAPTGGAGWWHWLVINIPAGTTRLGKDAGKGGGSQLPSRCGPIDTDFGGPGWGGPPPPGGGKTPRRHLTLYPLEMDR